MLPDTNKRVLEHTSSEINAAIAEQTKRNIERYVGSTRTSIDQRLQELAQEWDIERALEANAATLAFSGVVLGVLVDKRFLVLPGLVTAFLLQHATQGWCPPAPILRRLGFRTAAEINRERYALKWLRGDFERLNQNGHQNPEADELLAATAQA